MILTRTPPPLCHSQTSPEIIALRRKQGTRHNTPAAVPPVTGTADRREPHLLLVFPLGFRTGIFGAVAGRTAAAVRGLKPIL